MHANNDKKPTTSPPPPPGAKPVPATALAGTVEGQVTLLGGATVVNGSKPEDKADPKSEGDGNGEDNDADKAANRSKLFIIVGDVHEFATAAQAEKFLNQPGAPTKFRVVRGHEVVHKQRVSLRG